MLHNQFLLESSQWIHVREQILCTGDQDLVTIESRILCWQEQVDRVLGLDERISYPVIYIELQWEYHAVSENE